MHRHLHLSQILTSPTSIPENLLTCIFFYKVFNYIGYSTAVSGVSILSSRDSECLPCHWHSCHIFFSCGIPTYITYTYVTKQLMSQHTWPPLTEHVMTYACCCFLGRYLMLWILQLVALGLGHQYIEASIFWCMGVGARHRPKVKSSKYWPDLQSTKSKSSMLQRWPPSRRFGLHYSIQNLFLAIPWLGTRFGQWPDIPIGMSGHCQYIFYGKLNWISWGKLGRSKLGLVLN